MTDSHDLLESWLIEGAVGDPPRELAVHAAVCDSCGRRLGAFDSLSVVDVAAAGSPPPAASPSRLVAALLWARTGTVVVATVAAGVIVVVAASQLAGFVGGLPGPIDVVALESQGRGGDSDSEEPRSVEPGGEPSSTAEQTPTPSTFIPLPSQQPGATTIPAPAAPILRVTSVGQQSVSLAWTQPVGGGPPFKYEVWRRIGGGPLQKISDVAGSARSFTAGGLSPATLYRFQVKAVSASGLGSYSNVVTAATSSPTPTPPPPSVPQPTPTPPPPSVPQPTPTPPPPSVPQPTPTPPPPSVPPPSVPPPSP